MKWEREGEPEEGGRMWCSGQGGRQNRRLGSTALAAPCGAQLSPLPIHSVNVSLPLGQVTWAATVTESQ